MAIKKLDKPAQFLLKVGTHVEPVRDKDGVILYHENEDETKTKKQKTTHKHNDPKTCIVTSCHDLVKIGGGQKFERVHKEGVPLEEKMPETRAFDVMTIKELKEYANDNEIDVAGISKKDEITDIIKESLAE